ncbi:MAG: heterodisulfide reductase-related iron-sulfur binding cluster [Desulfosporosinus sp.]|nr:heterodisulfide reductase-related iron-sulfur binding cluster [Desulfosporosinus sp.]
MVATRVLFWNTNGKGVMYVCALIASVIFIVGLSKKIWSWQQGRPIKYENLGLRFKTSFLDIIKHNDQIFKGTFRRFMHLSVFYGFIVLLIGTSMIALQVDFKIPLFFGIKYLIIKLLMDLAGLFILIGIVMAAYKRYIAKRDHMDYSLDDAILLILVFSILFTGFILEGLRIYVTGDIWARWTPIGLLVSAITRKSGVSVQAARSFHAVLWYSHMLLAFGLIAYIPYYKLLHMFASSLNIFLKSSSPIGSLTPVDIILKEEKNIGVGKLEDFSKKQLIELDACVSCLRCQKGCPAYMIGAPLSPRGLIQSLKKHSNSKNSFFRSRRKSFNHLIIDQIISKETLWSCTTCGLCEVKCPIGIEHIKRIVDMRRSLITEEAGYPPEVQEVFKNISEVGNPWGLTNSEYLVKESQVPLLSDKKQTDILYWVGCFSSYESRSKKISQVMFKLFERAGVNYAVLGSEEKCCGDSVRHLGNEKLFQQLALENIKTLNQYEFKTLVTHCPHCYNVFKNEYTQFGGHYRVMHHSEYILELIKLGKIEPKPDNNLKVTFHDPCYLGRYNNLYKAPREVLASIPEMELVEMRNNQSRGFCCGAGGGRIWMEDIKEEKINTLLVNKALKSNSDILASACPLCIATLTEAVSSSKADIKSLDIAEIIYDAL